MMVIVAVTAKEMMPMRMSRVMIDDALHLSADFRAVRTMMTGKIGSMQIVGIRLRIISALLIPTKAAAAGVVAGRS